MEKQITIIKLKINNKYKTNYIKLKYKFRINQKKQPFNYIFWMLTCMTKDTSVLDIN